MSAWKRKALLVIGLLGILVLAAASCEPAIGDTRTIEGKTYKLTWSDEFNGTQLDTSKWSTGWLGSGITAPVQDQELACYDPKQVSVSDGALRLKVIAKQAVCNKGQNPHPYSSGAINSYGKAEFSHGYFEARIWVDGWDTQKKILNWPAFWLDGKGTWPTTGEMDIFEGLSGAAKANWHGPEEKGAGHTFGTGGYMAGWHVFAALWESTKVTAIYDGKKVGSYSSTTNITSNYQFLNLMEQVGPQDKYGGPIMVPSEMRVDWVRVWQ